MKKLIIIAAIALCASVTHAAAVAWTVAGANSYVGGKYDIFVIGQNGVTGASQIASLVAAGTDVTSYAFFANGSVAANGTAMVSVAATTKSIEYNETGTAADNTYTAFAVIWKSDGSEASYTSNAEIVLANNATGKTFLFGNQSSNLASNNFSVAPEPTSGLLLLLGVAGLALKRKRA